MSAQEKPDYLLEISQGFAKADQADMDQVRRDMRREQEWLKDEHKYETNTEIAEAYLRGDLILVGSTEYFMPIQRLRSEMGNTHIYQPYLKPGAAAILSWVTGRAHDYLSQMGTETDDIRYSVTSMIRSMDRQAELASRDGKLALPPDESGHSTGWDFDIDSSGYYLYQDAEWESVTQRDPERQRLVARAHEGILGNVGLSTLIARPGTYDKRVRHALHLAVAEFYSHGILAPVVEYTNTPNEVIHIGVNPNYSVTP